MNQNITADESREALRNDRRELLEMFNPQLVRIEELLRQAVCISPKSRLWRLATSLPARMILRPNGWNRTGSIWTSLTAIRRQSLRYISITTAGTPE